MQHRSALDFTRELTEKSLNFTQNLIDKTPRSPHFSQKTTRIGVKIGCAAGGLLIAVSPFFLALGSFTSFLSLFTAGVATVSSNSIYYYCKLRKDQAS